jgi:AcrR family transcriptional regulator
VRRPIRSVARIVGRVSRPFREQVDEGILDQAAALFARRGFAKTSVQDVADAVGLSKAGLLHHFPSKDALYAAVLGHADGLSERVLDSVRNLPSGAVRDRRALEALADVALAHPGLVALLLAPTTQLAAADAAENGPGESVLRAFGVDPETADPQRLVRVVGALSALAVLTLAAHAGDHTAAWRPFLVATCFDALGHHRGAALPDLDQVEA